MLYLTEVKKQKKGVMGSLKTELKLLAYERNDQKWSVLLQEKTIPAEEAKSFGDGALVIVNLDREQKIQETPKLASKQVLKILQIHSAILQKVKYQEEKIKEWEQSLNFQIQELNRREIEIEVRLEQIQKIEEALRCPEKQLQEIKKLPSCQQLGAVLRQADLVSTVQLELALQDKTRYSKLRLGEVLALRGWVKQETADFFAQQWTTLQGHKQKQPLGYYLKEAALLDEEQINIILVEQGKLKLRFGALAVLNGWLNQATLDFFLRHLFPEHESESSWIKVSDDSSQP